MAGYFILSTRKGDYRALAFQGSQVFTCHAQLSGLLRAHLGEAHARLLAEPLMDPQGTAVDWYTTGPVQPLAGLSPEAQEAVKTRLQGLLSDIEELAASLQTDSDPYKSLCGTMLHLATRFPTPECVYASLPAPSGDPAAQPQPVLVCWGMALSSAAAQEGIYAMGAAPFSAVPQTPLASGASGDPDRIVREGDVAERPAAPMPPTVVAEGEPWWKKLLMLLLGLLLALLLFWGLHFFFPWVPPLPLPAGCARTPAVEAPQPAPAVQASEPGPSEADLTALRAELEVLRQAAQKRAEACQPPAPPAVEPVGPKEEPPVEPPKDLGDLLGDLTAIPQEEPKPEPKPEPKKEQPAPKKEEPKPEPPKETPKKGDPMKLPDKDDKSMDFLDGCWNCRTGLSDTRGNPIKVRFCFGKNGKGQITIIDRQGKTYTGRADAQMRNGRLHIDTGDATSPKSRGSFNGLRIDCSPGAGNDAMCYGRNKGDNSPWSAKFFRD